jgi:hypothetical protein
MKSVVVAVVFIMLISSLVIFSTADSHATQPAKVIGSQMQNSASSMSVPGPVNFPKVKAIGGTGVVGRSNGSSVFMINGHNRSGIRLFPDSASTTSAASAVNSSGMKYYSINITFGTLPFSVLYGSWNMEFWINGVAYYFVVGLSDYRGVYFNLTGFINGTYYLDLGPTPFPYYTTTYSSLIVVNGSDQRDAVNFVSAQFEFEVYIVGVPEMTGLGLWTDYVGMPSEYLSFPPFTDVTTSFFANSTASHFEPATLKLMGSSEQSGMSQSMIEAELTFYGSAGSNYFQYNVSVYLTNGTLVGGADPAIVFNVTFSAFVGHATQTESLTGLYLPPGAIFNNVSMSFYNAPGYVAWDGSFAGPYGGVSYPQSELQTQVDLSLYKAGSTVGALNSLMSAENNTGFSTYAFAWANLTGQSFFVVGAFVPEYGTAVIPGYATSTGGIFTTLSTNYNTPLNFSGPVNVSAILNSTVLVNDTNLYAFYNSYYPSYAYYDYYPQLLQAVNLTQYSIDNSPYLSRNLMNFLPIAEAGIAVGGWGWNQRWAYPVLYPSASYYGTASPGLPEWMGTPYVFSELNSSSVAYLLGNYWNLSYTFSLYFTNNGTVSPGWGGGSTNVFGIVNGSLPDTNLSYWLNTLKSYNQVGKGSSYLYYKEGWTPYLVINVSVPYHNPSVTFYSGAEAAIGTYPAANESFVSYTYFYNDSKAQEGTGWQFANSTYTVRLMSFNAPSSVSYMYGTMRNDYVISFANSTANSIVPFAVNYSDLSNGTYGSVAGFPSEYAASYVEYSGSNPSEVGQSGSVNFVPFGTFKYMLSYAMYPYPVPMVYAVQGYGNSTFSDSNPFNYFSFHTYSGRTVFNVSVVNANYTSAFDTSGAVGSTATLSYNNMTGAFAIHSAYVGLPPRYGSLNAMNGTAFWNAYNSNYYPSLELGNYTGAMVEPRGGITYSQEWQNVDIRNNQSQGVWLYVGMVYAGNYSLSNVFQWLGQIENSTVINGTVVNYNLTQQQRQDLMDNLSSYSYGSGEFAVLHVGYNNFSFNLNTINGTLLVRIPTNGTVVTLEVFNVTQVYYVYYGGVFGYLDSYVGSINVTSAAGTPVPLWIFGIIPASLILLVIIHDVVNWFMGGTDRDSIFFWRRLSGGGRNGGERPPPGGRT